MNDPIQELQQQLEIAKEDYEILDECAQSYKKNMCAMEEAFKILRNKYMTIPALKVAKDYDEYVFIVTVTSDIKVEPEYTKEEFDKVKRWLR